MFGSFICGILHQIFSPFHQWIEIGKDLINLFIREEGWLLEFVLCESELLFGSCTALDCCFAKAAPVAGAVIAESFIGQSNFRF